MTYQDRRTLHLHPVGPGHLVAGIHGVITADTAQTIADQLAHHVQPDTREAHLNVDQANPLSAAAAAILLFPLLDAARTRTPSVTFTVHRVDARTRSHLRELGLGRILAYNDHPA